MKKILLLSIILIILSCNKYNKTDYYDTYYNVYNSNNYIIYDDNSIAIYNNNAIVFKTDYVYITGYSNTTLSIFFMDKIHYLPIHELFFFKHENRICIKYISEGKEVYFLNKDKK